MVCTLALVIALAVFPPDARVGQAQSSTAPQAVPPAGRKTQTAEELIALTDEVARQVEALRGWTFKQPIKKELTSVLQVREYLEHQAAKSLPDAKARRVQAMLRTIGLIPPTMELKQTWLTLLESQVAGFYDPDTKTMHLVSRDALPPIVERITLAHELTHALDDQYADLQAFTKARENKSEDLDLATESVVEGSATALMMQYTARAMMSGAADPKALQEYGEQEAGRNKAFLDAPRYFTAMLGSYICGMQFLARGQLMALLLAPDDRAVGEALLAARKDPPESTEQILHPEKYWDSAKRDEPVIVDDAAATRWLARPGRWIVGTDTIGEMLTAMLTSPPGTAVNLQNLQSAAWTNAAASGWGGDRFYLLASGDTVEAARDGLKDPKGVWVTAWDTAKDRDEFLASLPQGSLASGAVAEAAGPSVAIVYFGVDPAERTALTARLREKPLPMTQAGKPWLGR
jgi:hypothetical protein